MERTARSRGIPTRQGLRQLKGRDMITSFKDYLHEVFERPYRYKQVNSWMWSFRANDESSIVVFITGHNEVAFERDGEVDITGQKDQFKILGTVVKIIVSEILPEMEDGIVITFKDDEQSSSDSRYRAYIKILDRYKKKRIIDYKVEKAGPKYYIDINWYDEMNG